MKATSYVIICTALILACCAEKHVREIPERGDHSSLRQALEQTPNLANRIMENGELPLVLAARLGDRAAVAALLDAGADPNGRNTRGGTALMASRSTAVTELLLATGADVTLLGPDGDHILLYHCDDAAQLSLLLAAGAEQFVNVVAKANGSEADGWSPLMFAAYEGSADATRILLEHGARVDYRTSPDLTPLALAVEAQDPQTVEVLLDAGAARSLDGVNTGLLERAQAMDSEEGRQIHRLLRAVFQDSRR